MAKGKGTKNTKPIVYYHVKNQLLKRKKPAGCGKATKGRLIKFAGRDIRIKHCPDKKKVPKSTKAARRGKKKKASSGKKRKK